MSIARWILHEVFPNLGPGTYLEISKTNDHHQTIHYQRFLQKNWKIYLNYLVPNSKPLASHIPNVTITHHQVKNPDKFKKLISQMASSNLVHCFVAHTSKIYPLFQGLDLHKYRFGAIILKYPSDQNLRLEACQARFKLEQNYYQYYGEMDGYHCFRCSIGAPPYYLGQKVLNYYRITGNLKSGCGSSGVYIVRDPKNQKLVLKRTNNLTSFKNEVGALKITKTCRYTPKLIDYNAKTRLILTTWLGKDLLTHSETVQQNSKAEINRIHQLIVKQYKIYHNDIRWKNITFHQGQLYFIDWGMSSSLNTEKNHDKILDGDRDVDGDRDRDREVDGDISPKAEPDKPMLE